jgi:Ca2+-binding RTX toxin-like protein
MKTLLAVFAAAALLCAVPSLASAADPAWTCRASAAYVAFPGQDRIEPFVANGNSATATQSPDRERCADDEASAGSGGNGGISQQNPYARTSVEPDNDQAAAQTVTASAGADSTAIQSGSFSLTAAVARADASATCVGGQPAYTNSGSVAGVVVNGQPVSADAPLTQVGDGLNGSPLGGTIHVTFNEVTDADTAGGHTLTRRAIHVVITAPNGDTILETVVGEAKVGRSGDVCAPQTTTPPGSCPAGAVYDAATGYCVKTETVPSSGGSGAAGSCPAGYSRTESGACVREVFVTEGGQPVGGSVVPFSQIPGIAKSPCRARRFGKKLVAIKGTNGRDRVTGTNKSDRVFVLKASDIASGGRGNDCLEGGPGVGRLDGSTGSDYVLGSSARDALLGGAGSDRLVGRRGNDRLGGGFGSDRLYGGRGRDKLDGGPGSDYLDGGPGKDFITAGTGRNRIRAGRGNDVINAASAGPAARINCGPGRDTVRVNANEARGLRGCERVFVLRRRR